MNKVSRILALLMGAFIPFPTLGPSIAKDFTISPALVFGSMFCAINITRLFKRTKSVILFAFMILVFAVSNVGRNPFETYSFSLFALLVSVSPLLIGEVDKPTTLATLRGFLVGLAVTIGIAMLEFTSSVLGIDAVFAVLDSGFPDGRRGDEVPYLRPRAGFFEPSHLAIYLAFAYVIVDVGIRTSLFKDIVRALIVVSVLCVASLSGILILFVYIGVQWLPSIFRRGRYALVSHVLGTLAVCVVLTNLDTIAHSRLFERLGTMAIALSNGDLTGSEGSRVNAFYPVFYYWAQSDWLGILLGTGYSNYSDWLRTWFGNLGVLSSAGRGDIDNISSAVLLSTGIFGFLSYLSFMVSRLYTLFTYRYLSVIVFVISFHFTYGHFVSYLMWYLLYILANIIELRQGRNDAPVPRYVVRHGHHSSNILTARSRRQPG